MRDLPCQGRGLRGRDWRWSVLILSHKWNSWSDDDSRVSAPGGWGWCRPIRGQYCQHLTNQRPGNMTAGPHVSCGVSMLQHQTDKHNQSWLAASQRITREGDRSKSLSCRQLSPPQDVTIASLVYVLLLDNQERKVCSVYIMCFCLFMQTQLSPAWGCHHYVTIASQLYDTSQVRVRRVCSLSLHDAFLNSDMTRKVVIPACPCPNSRVSRRCQDSDSATTITTTTTTADHSQSLN